MQPTTNIFIDQYGPPDRWQCPDCGVLFDIYPALSFEHICTTQFRYAPKRVYYCMAGDTESGNLYFAVTADHDPGQTVHVKVGEQQVKLEKRSKGDLTVWRIPPEYDPIWGIDWQYDKRLQFGVRMPEKVQQQFAAQHRHSG